MVGSASPGARVRAADVGKAFADGTQALEGVDLEVDRGEFVALVGPSGCGKSTFLRLVAGLSTTSAGALTVDDVAPAHARARHRLAYVLQDPTLLPWRRVAANVALPLELRGQPAADVHRRVDEALTCVGLSEVAHMFPRQLSGGMRMRASLARALVAEPSVLLMDEPFAALDEITRHRLNDELLRLWLERRFTCLFVTHSVQEAAYLSQRVLVMRPRPAAVIAVHEIPFAAPRQAGLRTDSDFVRLVQRIGEDLAVTAAATP